MSQTQKDPKLGRRKASTAGPGADDLARIALDLFAERHYSSVTIKDIAAAANLNSAMIYYHYKDKLALFNAALDSAIDEAFRLFSEHCDSEKHDNAVSAVDAWLNVHVALHKRLRNVVKISLDCSGPEFVEARRSIKRFYRHEREILEEILRGGIEAGTLRDVEPCATATMISTFLDGVLARSLILRDFDMLTTVEEFKQALWLHLGHSTGQSKKKKARRPSAHVVEDRTT